MDVSDAANTRAFWDHMQCTTGSRSSSWDTFSATFETFLRRHFADEMSRLPAATRAEAEMVLRYAFDRGCPARASAGEDVTPRHLALFLCRFGPMRSCLLKAARSLFDASGCLVPWFHGKTSRDEATRTIEEWEASHGEGRIQRGVFLFRYSDRVEQPSISFSVRRKRGDKALVACLIDNGPQGFTLPDNNGVVWRDLQEFVAAQRRRGEFMHPVPSALHRECREEIELAPTPEMQISTARHLYAQAQALVIRGIGIGREATRTLEGALDLVQQAELTLNQLEEPDPQLQVKVLRLGGDILWRLNREEDGVASFLRCLNVVAAAEAEALEGGLQEGSPVVTASVLSHVHHLLAQYFLRHGSPAEGLEHFSELMACTTDEIARRQLVNEFRRTEGFESATTGLTKTSVQAMLDEAISYFRNQDYGPAGVRFEKVLRDARCIGEGEMEARALGNLATVDYKTHRIPAAIQRYKTCVQLLRQQGNQHTERKILNYLVVCCIEAQRWVPAKLFHDQLSKLAESEQNIQLLRRLQVKIEEGMALQARQRGGAASASGGGGSGGGLGGGGGYFLHTQQRVAAPTGGGGGGGDFYRSGREAAPPSRGVGGRLGDLHRDHAQQQWRGRGGGGVPGDGVHWVRQGVDDDLPDPPSPNPLARYGP